jgi:hypothetical protein
MNIFNYCLSNTRHITYADNMEELGSINSNVYYYNGVFPQQTIYNRYEYVRLPQYLEHKFKYCKELTIYPCNTDMPMYVTVDFIKYLERLCNCNKVTFIGDTVNYTFKKDDIQTKFTLYDCTGVSSIV